MRKLLAIALLMLLGMPFAASALALVPSESEANVPVCCRRGGAHHCSLGTQTGSDAPAFAVVTVRCPYPAARPVGLGDAAGVLAGGSEIAGLVGDSALHAVAEAERRVACGRSHLKRGPPAV